MLPALQIWTGDCALDLSLVSIDDEKWTGSLTVPHAAGEWSGIDAVLEQTGVTFFDDICERRFTLSICSFGTQSVAAAVRVSVDLLAPEPWWLIPGLFYGENRPQGSPRRFPCYRPSVQIPEAMVSDHWSFRSDRSATPVVMAWGESNGVALAAEQTTALGSAGLGFRGPNAGDVSRVHLDFPFREEPVTYYGSDSPRPPQALYHTFEPGRIEHITFRLFELPADRHSYASLLRREWLAAGERRSPAWVDAPTASELCSEALVKWHYDPHPGVLIETAGFDREVNVDGRPVDRQAMHVGWISGVPWAYALLRNAIRTDQPGRADAARNVVDFIASSLSPSGTFWGTWYREGGWSQSWTQLKNGVHARTLGEATLFMIRALELERDEGREHPDWERAILSNINVVAGRVRKDGNLGAIHDCETGKVLEWKGAAGLAWIPAFVEATEAGLGDYLSVARRAGAYYAQFVDKGFVHGAVEDVDLAPTSEDGYVSVMAYVALHRATGEKRWLTLAQKSAAWMLTFRYTYDVEFASDTLLGMYEFRTRGGDQASPSNQHLHNYGLICTKEMLELSAATGDEYYRDTALEAAACFRQFIARRDGDFNAYRGMVTERYYQTECFQPKGMILTLSHAWCLGANILGSEELIDKGLA